MTAGNKRRNNWSKEFPILKRILKQEPNISYRQLMSRGFSLRFIFQVKQKLKLTGSVRNPWRRHKLGRYQQELGQMDWGSQDDVEGFT